STPAGSEKSRIGSVPAAATSPTMNALLVSSRASQPVATCCIHVPTSEIVCPNQNSLKFRCLARVRNGFALRTAVPISSEDRGSRAFIVGAGAANGVLRVDSNVDSLHVESPRSLLHSGGSDAISYLHKVQPRDGRRRRSPVAARQPGRLSPPVGIRRRDEV